jgi:hypothetical protein
MYKLIINLGSCAVFRVSSYGLTLSGSTGNFTLDASQFFFLPNCSSKYVNAMLNEVVREAILALLLSLWETLSGFPLWTKMDKTLK